MIIFKTSAALAVALATIAPAIAGEWADTCTARLEADGRDASGCSCLEAEIEANSSLIDEFTALGAVEDPAERYASASDDAKAAMDKCTR